MAVPNRSMVVMQGQVCRSCDGRDVGAGMSLDSDLQDRLVMMLFAESRMALDVHRMARLSFSFDTIIERSSV